MKIYREKNYVTSNPLIWEKPYLKLGDGSFFVAKVIFTGFRFESKMIPYGPVIFRHYDRNKDKILGYDDGCCCVAELKFQDIVTNPVQETPASMYIYPFWLIHSVFLTMQLSVDYWIGMDRIYYFNAKGKNVGTSGSDRTKLADSWLKATESIVKRFDKKRFLKLMSAQFGNLELAIDRYSRACTEIVDESIIDFVVVLENLLSVAEEKEIAHRISVRASMILSTKVEEREKYYDVIKFFYNLRSRMVHGEIDEIEYNQKNQKILIDCGAKLTGKWYEDKYEISNLARKITRRVLLYFIDHEDKRNKKYLKYLDLGIKKNKKNGIRSVKIFGGGEEAVEG